jgi:type IV fimbrial biogenesis protein FimT
MKTGLSNNRGFTLVEVIVVVALIGILAGTAVFYVNRYLPIYRLREATRDMASTLQQARYEAVRRSSPCIVSFNSNGFDYLSFVDNNQNFQFDAGDVQLNAVRLANYQYVNFGPLGIAFNNNGAGEPTVGFNNRGLSIDMLGAAVNGLVDLQNTQGHSRQVVVNPAGNVRIQ